MWSVASTQISSSGPWASLVRIDSGAPRPKTLLGTRTRVLTRFNAFVGAPPPPASTPRRVHVGQDMGDMDRADRDFLTKVFAVDQARLGTLLEGLR